MKGQAPSRSAKAPISHRDRAAAAPMVNSTRAAVPALVSWGAKVSNAPPAMVTLNSTTVGETIPLRPRKLAGDLCSDRSGCLLSDARRTRASRRAAGTPSSGSAATQKTAPKPQRSATGTEPGSSNRLGTATAKP
jgi:hypothetical protein